MTRIFMVSAGADVENNVTVAYTSDKGLCGGINSTVTKYTRGVLRVTEGGELFKHLCSMFCTLLHRSSMCISTSCHASQHAPIRRSHLASQLHYLMVQWHGSQIPLRYAEGRKSDIVVMGEKGRAQLIRLERDRILSTVNDVNKMRITFSQAGPQALQPAACSMFPDPSFSKCFAPSHTCMPSALVT